MQPVFTLDVAKSGSMLDREVRDRSQLWPPLDSAKVAC